MAITKAVIDQFGRVSIGFFLTANEIIIDDTVIAISNAVIFLCLKANVLNRIQTSLWFVDDLLTKSFNDGVSAQVYSLASGPKTQTCGVNRELRRFVHRKSNGETSWESHIDGIKTQEVSVNADTKQHSMAAHSR